MAKQSERYNDGVVDLSVQKCEVDDEVVDNPADPSPPTDDTKAPEEAAPEKPPIEDVIKVQSYGLQHVSGAAYLYGSVASIVGKQYDVRSYTAYRDKMLEQFGNPTDPLEVMMVEQLLLAHHNVGRLHVRSGVAETHDVAAAYSAAATKLLGEFRRCLCALQDYRARVGTSRYTSEPGQDDKEAAQAPANGHSGQTKATENATNSQLADSNQPELPPRIRERMGISASIATPPMVPAG